MTFDVQVYQQQQEVQQQQQSFSPGENYQQNPQENSDQFQHQSYQYQQQQQQYNYADNQQAQANQHQAQEGYHQQQEQHDSLSQESQSQESYQNIAAAQPELTLDPSGQWFWDYPGQQWLPYLAQQPVEVAAAAMESLSLDQNQSQPVSEMQKQQNAAEEEEKQRLKEQEEQQWLRQQQQLAEQQYAEQQQQLAEQQRLAEQQQLNEQQQFAEQQRMAEQQHLIPQAQEQHQLRAFGQQPSFEQHLSESKPPVDAADHKPPPMMMSAAQAFESFSQEEEEAAREAYPAPQGEAAPPLRAAAVAEPESLGQKQDQTFSPVQSHGSMFDPSPPFPAQSARPPDVFSPSQQRSDTLGEGADGSPQTPPPAAHQALPPSNNNLGGAQNPPMLIQFSPHNDEAAPRQGDVRPPLGPPDLVDHGPSHPPLPNHPAPQGPPDLTQAQAQPPSSHDDHYNWYSDQQAGGMPDVTGVQV